MFATLHEVVISVADKGKIFGHVTDLINEGKCPALKALDFTVLMQLRAALLAECMATHDKKFRYMFGFVIFGFTSYAIHLKLIVCYNSKRLINLKSLKDNFFLI